MKTILIHFAKTLPLVLLPWYALGAESGLDGAISIKSQEAVVDVPIREQILNVAWLQQDVRVDGSLADWIAQGVQPVLLGGVTHATWTHGTYGGETDFQAKVWLGRDANYFYLAVESADDRAPQCERLELAFTAADTKLIVGWQDVGRRYKADDLHAVFVLHENEVAGIHLPHVQTRMDQRVVQDSYGSEAERRAHLEHQGLARTENRKMSAKVQREENASGRIITTFELALPWWTLLPYDPVVGSPLKMNLALFDEDQKGGERSAGALALAPGLVGVFSGAHFPTLKFEPPPSAPGSLSAFAQVPAAHYVNQPVNVEVSLRNEGEACTAKLQLLETFGDEAPLAEQTISLPIGLLQTYVRLDSETLPRNRLSLVARLVREGAEPVIFPVHSPREDGSISRETIADMEAKIASLEANLATFSNVVTRAEAAGLPMDYPVAYRTLLEMFIPRSREDLKRGDSDRVTRNTEHLKRVYAEATERVEAMLREPARAFARPPRFEPGTLTLRDGYWHDGERPVFLWGPCVFWYLKKDQPQVLGLGFNSVCTEIPMKLGAEHPEVQAHMEAWRTRGVNVNASMSVPDLQLTGSDVRASALLKEHPDLKNLDPNNFLPFVIQHPVARAKIEEGFRESIAFWNAFPEVGSYWLWNEPWYLNYSERTRLDFIQAMKKKVGTLDALNARWKSDFTDWNDITLHKWPNPKNTAPWYDFQQFRDDLLVDFFAFLHDTSKKYAPTKPTHAKFMAASLHSFNMERLQGIFDIAGHDGNSSDQQIMFLDFCHSLYPEKPLSNTEVHIWYGGKTAVERSIWRLALHGLADGNWWCWHSNAGFSDSLGNAESMHALTLAGLDIQRLFDPYVHAIVRRPAPWATLFPDVVERRSDLKMARLRYEVARPQYALGIRPHYATEERIAQGELAHHRILFAPETAFTKDSTYAGVLSFVQQGGTVLVSRGGFAQDELGNPRDTSALIHSEGGEPFGAYARRYPLGKGFVICIDAIEMRADPVKDGSVSMTGGGPEFEAHRRIYHSVLAQLQDELHLAPPARLVAADPLSTLADYDWGCADVEGDAILAVLPGASREVSLQSDRPIGRITDLIRDREVPADSFTLDPGPNLFRIEWVQ